MNNFQPGGTATLSTPIELSLTCKDLLNSDLRSNSDPFIVVSTFEGNRWVEIGRTEVIEDDLNPEFAKKFNLDYRFETQQKYKFAVYDKDENSSDLRKHDFLGHCYTTLGEIVGASNGRHRRQLFRI